MPGPTVIRCHAAACHRPFQLNRFREGLAAVTRGVITCPHCGATTSGDPHIIYIAHSLLPEEEEKFESALPR
ncbi:hypothetical protein GCM10027343_02690 [Noviherbaspirillum agri]